MRILYIEDNQKLAQNTAALLRQSDFVVDCVTTAADALHAVASFEYDAAILDLGLPDTDGMALLDRLRGQGPQIPVLICTARDTLEDRIAGLNGGSDDYLVKPFAVEELIARLRAILRRPGGALGLHLRAGNLTLDTVARDVRIDGKQIKLSRRELDLLEVFLRRKGRVLSRSAIADALYGFNDEPTPNAIEVAAHRLRKKLADLGASLKIETLRGIGYVLEDDGT
ncbi:response regulator transcription factor [Roseovarius sp. A21]|uniref:Response regulator transcription factor n=1 Tax=Roseovarius bejariae TaxID=2576383 RepID=A0A844CJS4_9RHOB|nr:response regulator transcription factor [Roseovarius bejariae]